MSHSQRTPRHRPATPNRHGMNMHLYFHLNPLHGVPKTLPLPSNRIPSPLSRCLFSSIVMPSPSTGHRPLNPPSPPPAATTRWHGTVHSTAIQSQQPNSFGVGRRRRRRRIIIIIIIIIIIKGRRCLPCGANGLRRSAPPIALGDDPRCADNSP